MVEVSLHPSTETDGKFLNPPSPKTSFHRFLCRKQHRRLAMQVLNARAIEGFTSAMEYESHILIKSLYEQGRNGELPINPAHYTGRFALKLVSSPFCAMLFKLTWIYSNMLMISFGMRTDSFSDPLIVQGLELAMEFMALTGQYLALIFHISDGSNIMVGPWANAVDFFEPLQWVPTSKRTRARKLHDGFIDVYGSMIRRFKTLMDSGEEVPDCLMKMLLESQENEKLEWEDICMLSAVFTLGGVHSVSGAVLHFEQFISRILCRHLASYSGFLL